MFGQARGSISCSPSTPRNLQQPTDEGQLTVHRAVRGAKRGELLELIAGAEEIAAVDQVVGEALVRRGVRRAAVNSAPEGVALPAALLQRGHEAGEETRGSRVVLLRRDLDEQAARGRGTGIPVQRAQQRTGGLLRAARPTQQHPK